MVSGACRGTNSPHRAGAEGEHLVPALSNSTLLISIPRLAANADRFGSVCSGGFFLAALGWLMDAAFRGSGMLAVRSPNSIQGSRSIQTHYTSSTDGSGPRPA